MQMLLKTWKMRRTANREPGYVALRSRSVRLYRWIYFMKGAERKSHSLCLCVCLCVCKEKKKYMTKTDCIVVCEYRDFYIYKWPHICLCFTMYHVWHTLESVLHSKNVVRNVLVLSSVYTMLLRKRIKIKYKLGELLVCTSGIYAADLFIKIKLLYYAFMSPRVYNNRL